ncbi:MAG TPA: porin [Caulobacterales bacterium]|nr:porin [Caulobacterales bacterium]
MSVRTLAMFGASWLALAGAAAAQQASEPIQTNQAAPADPRDARIRELERRLEDIEGRLNDLKASTAAESQDIRTTLSSAPQTSINNGRAAFATADGSQKLAVRALVQFDATHYDQDDPATPDNRRADTAAASDLNSGTNFRRARLGVDGTAFKDWNYAIWGEWGGSGAESAVLNQAYIEYAGWKPLANAAPIRFRIGAWATPTSLEDATPTADLLFVERPAAAELVRGIAAGDGRSGIGVFANGDRWYGSAVYTGSTIGATGEFDEQSGYLLRAAFLPLRGENYGVHVGVNASGILDVADVNASPADTQSVRLRERPELRTDATRFVDTGSIAARGVRQYGLELGGQFKNFYLASEAFQVDLDRSGGVSDPSFRGWYAQGAWTLTGERRRWNGQSGGFAGIRPTNAFDPKTGHWGAWEIAARYSDLDLNYHEGAPGLAPVAGDSVRGGEQEITSLGLNWYPNSVVRFLLDYQWVSIDRLDPEDSSIATAVAGTGAQIGQDFQAITLRSQFAF